MAKAKAAVTGFPLGIEISIGLHVLVVLIIWGALHFHPGAMSLPPVSNPFDHAIAVSLTPAPHPQPKPKTPPTPQVPKPQPPAVETQATQSQNVVPPPRVKPSPAQMPQQQEQDQEQANPDYAQIVEQILNENKRYPREAVLSGTEGEVVLYFVINSQGLVLAYHIDKSSGSDVLDQEVQRLIRSVRFPPFAPGDKSPRKELTVPIEFKLGAGTNP
ncbi:MAG TPA: energy transducer TonB [Gammaproteobacteria bacterium]|jgi:protein TonB